MERWTLAHYKHATIHELGELEGDAFDIHLLDQTISVSGTSDSATHELWKWLKSEPHLDDTVPEQWRTFIEELDQFGFIEDRHSQIEVNEYVRFVNNELHIQSKRFVQQLTELDERFTKWKSIQALLVNDLNPQIAMAETPHLVDLFTDNFYVTLSRLLIRAWARTEPITINIIRYLFTQSETVLAWLAGDEVIEEFSELYTLGPETTLRRLSVMFSVLEKCVLADSLRYLNLSLPSPAHPAPAINLAIQLEQLARQAIGVLENSTKSISPHTRTHNLDAVIEQYFIDARFLETIAPAMARNIPTPLKSMFRQYYQEEIGHEEYDAETCLDLGLSFSALTEKTPRPLTEAFCEILILLSSEDLLSYLFSLVLTEGLPGDVPFEPFATDQDQTSPPTLRGVAKHAHFNMLKNHHYLTRLLAAECKYVTPHQFERIVKMYLYVLELNHRIWMDIEYVDE